MIAYKPDHQGSLRDIIMVLCAFNIFFKYFVPATVSASVGGGHKIMCFVDADNLLVGGLQHCGSA